MEPVLNEQLEYTYSEEYRHLCEVESIVRIYRTHGGERVKSYLLQVEKRRGSEAAARLREQALRKIK